MGCLHIHVAALGLLLVSTAARAQTVQHPISVEDPVFGLRYDSANISFDPAPRHMIEGCPELVNHAFNRRMYVFAHMTTDDGEIFLVGGFFLPKSGLGEPLMDPKGVLLTLSHKSCTLVGPGNEVFSGVDSPVDARQLRLLADDAVRRYASAFGGIDAFRHVLAVEHVPVAPVLRDAIAAAR